MHSAASVFTLRFCVVVVMPAYCTTDRSPAVKRRFGPSYYLLGARKIESYLSELRPLAMRCGACTFALHSPIIPNQTPQGMHWYIPGYYIIYYPKF